MSLEDSTPMRDTTNKSPKTYLLDLHKNKKALYIVLTLHEDISTEHQKYCYCEGVLADCYVRPLTTISYAICNEGESIPLLPKCTLLSSDKVTHEELVTYLFTQLSDYKLPLLDDGVLFTIEMTHDEKFSAYNNYFRKYCNLEYFDEEKLEKLIRPRGLHEHICSGFLTKLILVPSRTSSELVATCQ